MVQKRPLVFGLISSVIVAMAACGGDDETKDDETTSDAIRGGDAGTLADPLSCGPPLMVCGINCIDPNSDPEHCGGCDRRCEGEDVCSQGACVSECPGGKSTCGAECVDTDTAHANCGACGRACASDETCQQGVCTSGCSDGLTECEGGCFDLQTATDHCGACGAACSADQRCRGGTCGACELQTLQEIPVEIEMSTEDLGDYLTASCVQTESPEAAFGFTAPLAGRYVFTTAGSTFNTVLYALDGDCGGTEIACDDDGAGGLASRLELELDAAQHVVVVVEGYAKQFGDFTLSVEEQSESNCCQEHPEPGCNAPQVEECVCAFDSFCCDTEWDALCVDIVRSEGCAECEPLPEATCDIAGSSSASPDVLSANLEGAADDIECTCGSFFEADVLFHFTAPESGTYSFDTAGSEVSDTVLSVLSGSACSDEELACNDDHGEELSSQLDVELSAGQEVLIAVESWDNEPGMVQVAISVGSVQQLSDNDCGARDISGTLPIEVSDSVSTESSLLTPSCAVFGSEGEVFYSFTADQEGVYRFDTSGSSADTIVQILDGDCTGPELACNDDSDLGGLAALVDVDLSAGQTVTVSVDSFDGLGDFVLNVDLSGDSGGVITGNTNSCCTAHLSGGCADDAIAACVCADDDYCCEFEWDELCVDAVDTLACGSCAS